MASSPLTCEWPRPRLPIFPVSPGLTLPNLAAWWAQQILSESGVFIHKAQSLAPAAGDLWLLTTCSESLRRAGLGSAERRGAS